MDPMTIALVASGVLGLAKSQEQQKAYQKQQGIEALKTKWSPFTHDPGKTLERPSQVDPLMQSLLTGAMLGQSLGGGTGDESGLGTMDGSQALTSGDGNMIAAPGTAAAPGAPAAPNVAGYNPNAYGTSQLVADAGGGPPMPLNLADGASGPMGLPGGATTAGQPPAAVLSPGRQPGLMTQGYGAGQVPPGGPSIMSLFAARGAAS